MPYVPKKLWEEIEDYFLMDCQDGNPSGNRIMKQILEVNEK